MAKIKKINIGQAAKFSAVFYGLMVAIFIVPFMLMMLVFGASFDSEGPFAAAGIISGVFMLFFVPMYALIGATMIALMSFLYNLVAKWVGGIEIEIENS